MEPRVLITPEQASQLLAPFGAVDLLTEDGRPVTISHSDLTLTERYALVDGHTVRLDKNGSPLLLSPIQNSDSVPLPIYVAGQLAYDTPVLTLERLEEYLTAHPGGSSQALSDLRAQIVNPVD